MLQGQRSYGRRLHETRNGTNLDLSPGILLRKVPRIRLWRQEDVCRTEDELKVKRGVFF